MGGVADIPTSAQPIHAAAKQTGRSLLWRLIVPTCLGVAALVPFAPGAMSWELNVPLQGRLIRAVDLAKAPVFMIQAQNDYDLAPSRVLSKEASKKKKDFQSKVYPPFGTSHHDGHWGFCSAATDVWGNDVLAFLDAHMKPSN